MRLNLETAVVGERVVLKPYRAAFVARYHAWMEDPWILEMTASERLSIEEEYKNQKLWIEDEKKLTFLVFEGTEATLGSEECLPAPEASPGELAEQLRGICGDVNIFMCDPDHSEDYAEASGAIAAAAAASAAEGDAEGAARSGLGTDPVTAEIMVMIADAAYRGKGLATEAVCAMMRYGMDHLRISTFVAKITDSNAASIALFAKLGFIEAKRIAAFEEVHMVCGPAQGLRERVHAITGRSSYREHKYTWGR